VRADPLLRQVSPVVGDVSAHYEWVAVELRIVLELIIMGSPVTNREAMSKVSSVSRIKGVGQAQKIVEQINPEYWPTPMAGSRRPDGTLAL
jgi:hypothetical protein